MKSDMAIRFMGRIEHGKFKLHTEEKKIFLQYCSGLRDGDYNITIKRTQNISDENRLYISKLGYIWGTVYSMIADHTGQFIHDVHIELKLMFLPKWVEIQDKNGEITMVQTFRSIALDSDVTLDELRNYGYQCRDWGNDFLGLNIPLPERREI